MKRHPAVPTSFVLAGLVLAVACGESREERLKRQLAYEQDDDDEKSAKELPPDIPPHPLRDKLAPVLNEIYSQKKLPDVLEADIEGGEQGYELTPGVMSVIRLEPGMSKEKQVRAIITATAEADGFAFRSKSRRTYAEQLHKVMRGYGDDQKELVLEAYADLKLLDYFNGKAAKEHIAKLPGDVKPVVQEMRKEYVNGKDEVWDQWMEVKMYARRVVAGDEPFRSVLKNIRKELGKEEPPPRTWMESMDAPFKGWAKQIKENEELLEKLTNLRELRQREEFLGDTHSLWVVQGSDKMPEKAKGLKPDKEMGFAALREDLGGGYNDMTYVFSRRLKGDRLKKAFLRSIVYGSLLSDFQLLATAGNDFADRKDGKVDAKTGVVPDEYDPLYAKCGSEAALNTFITHYKDEFGFLEGLSPSQRDSDAILNKAHKCVIEGARGDIWIPPKDDEKDIEGPAPGSRLGLYQMLARFENVDVNMARMEAERTEEDDAIEDAEAVLERIKKKREAGKGVK